MSLAVAIQMDPIEWIDIDADSTFVLALEAQRRGHGLYHYLPTDLSYDHGRVMARARPLEVRRERGNHATLGAAEVLDLRTFDIVLMRQDPPFDLNYIGATHLLERVHPDTLVINDPVAVRNAPEKLFVTQFPDLMPPTLITFDPDQIKAFRAVHEEIILKPIYGNGGVGVFHIRPDDDNLNSLLVLLGQAIREPLVVQRYLPEIKEGDKRIVLIDGEPHLACLTLAESVEGRSIETTSGLAEGPNLHPLQQAFMDHFAAQCGFCTPGMLVAAKALLDRNPSPSREEIVEAISGNICRCTGYESIIKAIQDAATRISGRRIA